MKIAVDIRSAGGERDGKGNYTYHLIKSVLDIDSKNQYILFGKTKIAGFEQYGNVEFKLFPDMLFHLYAGLYCKKEDVDVFFSPASYITPVFIPRKTKVLLTVHDLVALLYSYKHNKKAVILEKLFLGPAAKKAEKILAVSENTGKDLVGYLPKTSSKIHVIPCAANSVFQKATHEELEEFKKSTNLPDKFFLAVGTIQPRKNYLNLIRALNSIHRKFPDIHLIIVGKKGWNYREVFEEIDRYKLSKHVHILGYLSENSIKNLYNLALALVFPSFYEGFGIPPLEAMQCACPVICSDSGSLPEVAGNAALYINPKKYKETAKAMEKLIKDLEFSKKLSQKGFEHAKKFTWHNSAKEFLKIIDTIYNQKV